MSLRSSGLRLLLPIIFLNSRAKHQSAASLALLRTPIDNQLFSPTIRMAHSVGNTDDLGELCLHLRIVHRLSLPLAKGTNMQKK
jgi:hypothetical protein